MKISQVYKKTADKIIQNNLKDSPSLFIIDYSGVAAADMNVLRESLRKAKSRMLVLKNSIIKRAFSNTDKEALGSLIEGPSSIIFAKDDPALSAKILYDFRKGHESLKLKAGLLKDKLLDTKAIEVLARLPSRSVLIAQAVGGIKAPLSSLVFCLSGNLRKLAYILDEIKKKKQ